MSAKPLHHHVAASLAELCIERMAQHHRALPAPSDRAGYHCERAAHAELELCTLVGAIAGAEAEARLTAVFFPRTCATGFASGLARLEEAKAAAGTR